MFLKSLQNQTLPIADKLADIGETLRANSQLILQAEPGAGKTTLVPLALLDYIEPHKKILVLEPRRLAARNAAIRMSEIVDKEVGTLVGFRTRDEVKVSKQTRIEVITERILVRMLNDDPEMEFVDVIIFDEFHERNLDAELALALCLEVQETIRDDLRLLIMSATIDTRQLSLLLPSAPIIHASGKCFPVTVDYVAPPKNKDWKSVMLVAIKKALQKTKKDILVFLPGKSDIYYCISLVENNLSDIFSLSDSDEDEVFHSKKVQLLALYGNLNYAEQKKIFKPNSKAQRIIFATNIAESSLTIDGVECVIDSGLEKQTQFEPRSGFNKLITIKISNASAIQRQGRAGRLSAGHCIRLWSKEDNLREHTTAEILRTDLAGLALQVALWGAEDICQLSFIEQPNQGAYQQALSLLSILGAINKDYKITAYGKRLSLLGVHPRVAHMLLQSEKYKTESLACLIAAMLDERDVFQQSREMNIDFMSRLSFVVQQMKSPNTTETVRLIVKRANRLYRKIQTTNASEKNMPLVKNIQTDFAPVLLALCFPERVGIKRGQGYLLANGGGARLRDDVIDLGDCIVAVNLGGKSRTAFINQAVSLSKNDLTHYLKDQVQIREKTFWEQKSQSIKSETVTEYFSLVLSCKPCKSIEPNLAANILLMEIKKQGLSVLPWNNSLRQWQVRVIRLRELAEYADLFPDVSDKYLLENLASWLKPYLSSSAKKVVTRFADISEDILVSAITGLLSWEQSQLLQTLMPTHLKVASGSKIKLDYLAGNNPILSVKLQEMFGEKETPLVAEGRISVIVHLLSPAKRPLQITQDLASFWKQGYPQVKKEMKGKYPKHPWPDDPLTAIATGKTKKKMQKNS